MKTLLVLVFLLAGGTSSFAQSMLTKKSERVTEATGYSLNGSTYSSNKNMIASAANNKKKIQNPNESNFYWLQSGVFSQGGKTLHIFYYEDLSGEYKYPNIHEDWQDYHEISYFALSDSAYAELKSIISKKEGHQQCISTSLDRQEIRMMKFDESEFTGKVAQLWNLTLPASNCFLVKSLNVNGKDVVHFKFDQSLRDSPNLMSSYFEVSLDDFKKLLVD